MAITEQEAKDLAALMLPLWNDPVFAIKEIWGVDLWEGQIDLAEAIRDHKYVSCATGNSFGKTELVSYLIPLYVISHYPSYVILSSATWDQMRQSLLTRISSAIHKLQSRMTDKSGKPILSNPSKEEWWPGGVSHQWAIIPMSPDNVEVAAGKHNKYVWVIFDESSGLEKRILDAAHGMTVRPDHKITLLGNPLEDSGPFFDSHHSKRDAWKTLRVSTLTNPNFRSGKIVLPYLPGPDWVREMERQWRKDTPEFNSRVKAEFPTAGSLTVVTHDMIEKACARKTSNLGDGDLIIGCDYGESLSGDPTVFIVRRGMSIIHMEEHLGLPSTEAEGATAAIIRKFNPDRVYTDDGGMIGMSDRLRSQGFRNVTGIKFGRRARNAKEYVNVRAEMFFNLRLALVDGLSIPRKFEDIFLSEAGIRYKYDRKGRIIIEAKEDIRERIGRSTDHLDALALTFVEEIGDSAVTMLDESEHRVWWRPQLHDINDGNVYMNLDGMPISTARPGSLNRSIWMGGPQGNAAIWVHVDENQVWTVVDSLKSLGPVTDFLAAMKSKSRDHRYSYDLISTDGSEKAMNQTYATMTEIGFGDNSFPQFVSPGALSSKDGLDWLQSMLVSALAHRPDHPYWSSTTAKPSDYHGRSMLLSFPEDVLDDISNVRWRPLSPQAEMDGIQDLPMKLIEPLYVKCLRLLVIYSAMMA